MKTLIQYNSQTKSSLEGAKKTNEEINKEQEKKTFLAFYTALRPDSPHIDFGKE